MPGRRRPGLFDHATGNKIGARFKGQASAVTRYGSTTHFYLRAALKHVGLNPERDMTILQLGAGPEMVVRCSIAAPSLPPRSPRATPFHSYSAAGRCSSISAPPISSTRRRASPAAGRLSKREPKTTHEFLRAYVAGIHLIKKIFASPKNHSPNGCARKTPRSPRKPSRLMPACSRPRRYVPDKGIENVIQDLIKARPDFKEYLGWPEPFRENGPLEKVLRDK